MTRRMTSGGKKALQISQRILPEALAQRKRQSLWTPPLVPLHAHASTGRATGSKQYRHSTTAAGIGEEEEEEEEIEEE